MKYLLDTSVLVDHLRGKNIIDQKVIEAGAGISIITLGELFYGAQRSSQTEKKLNLIFELLEKLSIGVINLNANIVLEFSIIKVKLEQKGKRLEDFDLLIGATALYHKLTLVTRNTKHFERIKGVKINL